MPPNWPKLPPNGPKMSPSGAKLLQPHKTSQLITHMTYLLKVFTPKSKDRQKWRKILKKCTQIGQKCPQMDQKWPQVGQKILQPHKQCPQLLKRTKILKKQTNFLINNRPKTDFSDPKNRLLVKICFIIVKIAFHPSKMWFLLHGEY